MNEFLGDFYGTLLDLTVLKHCDLFFVCLLIANGNEIIPFVFRVSPKLYNMFEERKEK